MKEVNKNIVIAVVVAILVAVIGVAMFMTTKEEEEAGMPIQQDAVLIPQAENTGLNIDPVTGGAVLNEVAPAVDLGASGALNNESPVTTPASNPQGGTAEAPALNDSATQNRNQPSPNKAGENE